MAMVQSSLHPQAVEVVESLCEAFDLELAWSFKLNYVR